MAEAYGWMGHEIRRLKFLLGKANRLTGKQGQTIYELRCQVAELRDMIGKENRGYYRRIETELSQKVDQLAVLRGEIERLREKLEEEK